LRALLALGVTLSAAACGANVAPPSVMTAAQLEADGKTPDLTVFDTLTELQADLDVQNQNWVKDLKARTATGKWVHVSLVKGDKVLCLTYGGGICLQDGSPVGLSKIKRITATLKRMAAQDRVLADKIGVFLKALDEYIGDR
jgi:hypothetical protein